ncbi:MAG TPA: hypothetical protein VFN99_02370, partial [Gaiella sp.]|nr:hypothetical protein [Gaiella sp.]
MAATDQPGLNAAYVAQLLEDYLEAPASVPDEWRQVFESDADGHDGGNGAPVAVAPPPPAPAPAAEPAPPAAPQAPPTPAEPDQELLGGVAAAMALVKAIRMHGHLAARLDPLGSEPMGDPAL